MAKRTFTYSANFDGSTPLNGATLSNTSGAVGVKDALYSPDFDNELVLYDGVGSEARLNLNAGLDDGDRVTSFTTSFQMDFLGQTSSPQFGNLQGDGFSFNLGANVNGAQEELGVSEGLAIRVRPYSYDGTEGNALEIVWNGTVIGSTSLNNQAEDIGAVTFSASVTAEGEVTASFGSFTASGSIPGSEWKDTNQDGWDFHLAGRTGANAGEAYVDDMAVSASIVCFAADTQIDTPCGPRAIADLREGDLVRTLDHGAQPVRWINKRPLSRERLLAEPKLRPVRISRGALGEGLPQTDLVVSQQHRVVVRSKIAARMFGAPEVMVAAKHLIDLPGIEIDDSCTPITYVHFLFDQHELVVANGAPSESLFAGPQAMLALGGEACQEILALFPEKAALFAAQAPMMAPARLFLTGREGRELARRHAKNARALLSLPPAQRQAA